MNEQEKLQWLIDHNGDCHEDPWDCDDCPLDGQCGFGMIDEQTVAVAKILLASKEAEEKHDKRVLKILGNRPAVDRLHEGISAMKEIDRKRGVTAMEDREKLNWLIEHKGVCDNCTWSCHQCPVVGGTCVDYEILGRAKNRLGNLNEKEKKQAISHTSFHRDDHVLADGKEWRIDYTDGPYLGLSAPDGSHKELHKHVCKKVDPVADFVADVLARVTMP